MVVLALLVPFAGTALANHIASIAITPTTDTAPAGTCNAFTVTLLADGKGNKTVPAEGETVDVIVADTDADNNGNTTGGANESDVSFCTPAGTQQQAGQGSDEFGPNPRGTVPNNTGQNKTDDNIATRQQGTTGPTDNKGQVTFGITSSETGTFSVTVFFDENNDNNPAGEFTAAATKTFTAGFTSGSEAVKALDCSPETDTNPEGTNHDFTCVATDVNGNPVAGATVTFDVTAGPNAEEVGNTQCGSVNANTNVFTAGTTNQTGTVTCRYTDVENADTATGAAITSPPGTDTIIAFVNQTPPAGQSGTPGADSFEPQDTILKTFVGDANTINCTPDGGTARSGDVVTITCTVTDEVGQPVPGVVVNFTESGVGAFRGATTCTTGATGTCTTEIVTGANETGTITVTGAIAPQSAPANNGSQPAGTNVTGSTNCQANGTAEAGTNAKCSDTATVTVSTTPPPPLAQCEDGVDNDGDGRIDFPNDPGCANGDDDTENTESTQPPPPPPTEIRRERTIEITRLRHVFLPGKNKPALLVRGVVRAPTLPECASEVPIKVQIRAGGTWITRKSDTTNSIGVFKVLIRDVAARYRAVAPKFQIEDTTNNILNICLKANDVRRHRHRGR
jgi:hypothetical protein